MAPTTMALRSSAPTVAGPAAGRPSRAPRTAVVASAHKNQNAFPKAAGAAALSAAILLGQGTMGVPPSQASATEHVFVMGGLRSAVNNIKNVGKQGIPEPEPVEVPNSETPAQTKNAIPIPTMPDLLKSVADPNPAPGEGPLNTLAREERASEGNLNAPPNEAGPAGNTDPAFRNQTRNKLFSQADTGSSLKNVINDQTKAMQRFATPDNSEGASAPSGKWNSELVNQFKDAAGPLKAGVQQAGGQLGGTNNAAVDIGNVAVESLTSLGQTINDGAAKAARVAGDTVNTDKVSNVANKLDIKGATDRTARAFSDATGNQSNVSNVDNGLSGALDGAGRRIGQAARDVVQGTPTDAKNNAQTTVGNAKRQILGGSASLPRDLQRKAEDVGADAKSAARQVNAKTSKLGDKAADAFSDAKRAVGGAADDAVTSAKGSVRQVNIGSQSGNALNDAKRSVSSAADDATTSLKSGARQVNVKGSSAGDKITNVGKEAVRNIKDALPGSN